MFTNKVLLSFLFLMGTSTLTLAANWMDRLPDNMYVANVSIPGTHDSATGSGWTSAIVNSGADTYSKTQELSIADQWDLGIRAFDFRPAEQSGYMSLNHGVQITKLKFEETLTQLCGYLDANPTEFIVIHLLKGTGDNYVSRVNAVLTSSAYANYIKEFRTDLTVGELRGHILVLCREWLDWDSQTPLGSASFGWWDETSKAENPDGADSYILSPTSNRGKVVMQDIANTSTTENMNKKKSLMTSLLRWSSHRWTNGASDICWVFNFASAYNKETSLIGNKLSTSEGYRSNATVTNKLVIDYLSRHTGPTGIILMDYVGCDDTYGIEAVNAIIDNNFGPRHNIYNKVADLQWLHRGTPSVADYNNDGRMDIYYGGEQYDWQVKGMLCTQQAGGSFTQQASSVSGGNTAEGLPPMVYGYSRWLDIDNDGSLDFLVNTRSDNDYQPGDKTFLYRNSSSQFTKVEGTPFLDGYNEHATSYNAANNSSVSFADYDRDGFQDVVQQAWTAGGREAVLFRNNGDGTFSRALDLVKTSHGSVTFGDLNNDGWPDIVLTGWEDGNHYCEFYIYRNNGDGSFTQLRMTDQGFTGICNSDVCLTDLNADGLLDIVATGNNGGARTDIYMNQGSFSFTKVTDHGIDGIDEGTIHAVDLNYDGRADLILTGNSGTQLSDAENGDGQGTRIYLQKSDGTFVLMPDTQLPPMGQGGLAIGDLTGRGAMDIAIVGNEVGGVYQLAGAPQVQPTVPTGLNATVSADGLLTVCWNAASETGISASALAYNVYVKNNSTGQTSMLLPANTSTGRLMTIQDMQNAVRGNLSYSVKLTTGGTYTVGVQTVDASFVTSNFATTTVAYEHLQIAQADATTRVATLEGILTQASFAAVEDEAYTAYDLTGVTISGNQTITPQNPNTILVVSDTQRELLPNTNNLLTGTKLYNAVFTDGYDVNTSFTGLKSSGKPKYVRTLTGTYATVILPFKLSESNLKSNLTDKGIIAYQPTTLRTDQAETVLRFEAVTQTTAATAYLLKRNDSSTETITIEGASSASLSFSPVATEVTSSASEQLSFAGTFVRKDDMTGCYVLPANSNDLVLRPCSATAWTPAFHCYFTAPTTAARTLRIAFPDDTTTGISAMQNEKGKTTSDKVFDIQGRRLQRDRYRPAPCLTIRNGKKYITK